MRFRTGASQCKSCALSGVWETLLRTGNARDPNGPQVSFASESFMHELAVAAHADPVTFRPKLLTASTYDFKQARSIAVIRAAADAYGWDSRVSPKPRDAEAVLTGRCTPNLAR